MQEADFNLTEVLKSLKSHHSAGRDEIKFLLGLTDPEKRALLYKAARDVRSDFFGNRIFLYGFLYFSTHCRNDCNFCQYRKSNTSLIRYRKTEKEILSASMEMARAGVHLIDLTMGEDPDLYSSGELGISRLVNMVRHVRKSTGLPLMISPGTVPDHALKDLADAGATWYACYQETHNKKRYQTLRQGQGFSQRIHKKTNAKHLGMLIEEGILTGVGETLDDLADSILWMKEFGVDQARVMTFVPQPETPMADVIPQNSLKEQVIISVIRLLLPDLLIPASLDVDGLSGLEARLNAGANVVTSIVPPHKGLSGVANQSLDIDESRRTCDVILPVLTSCGLTSASPREYMDWVSNRQEFHASQDTQAGSIIC